MRPSLNTRSKQRQRGVTLIEVLVSMVIFSVGILGMSALQVRVLQQTHDQKQRDVAIWRAQALMDRITINSAAVDTYITSINNNDFCEVAPTVTCTETFDAATDAEIPAAVCTNVQMATYDSWEMLCSDNGGINNELADLTTTLSCQNNANPCPAGNTLTIELAWESYASTADPRLTGNTTIVKGDNTTDNIAANLERYRQVFIP